MRIGIVIPAHGPKLCFLKQCLESIEKQTRLPDVVAISASSCDDFELSKYSFPIKLICTRSRQNASTNRNRAAELLEGLVDVIRFFDCDDEMVPQCLTFLEKAFTETNSVLIVHNFVLLGCKNQPIVIDTSDYQCFPGVVKPNSGWIGCKIFADLPIKQLAHGHASTLYAVWKDYKFPEDKNGAEDCAFCETIALNYPERCGYIPTQLSIYHHYR